MNGVEREGINKPDTKHVHGNLLQQFHGDRVWLPSREALALQLCMCLVIQSCSTLCDPMDCSLPGSSVHGILHVRILEWVAMPFSKGSSQPRSLAGRFFTTWAAREAQ